jgi:hypothetical protein
MEAVIKHLEQEKDANLGPMLPMLRCEVALRFKDIPALEACTGALTQMAPNDPKTISLQWALAVEKRDRPAALGFLDRARSAGVNGEALAKMEDGTRAIRRRQLARLGLLIIAAALVGVGLRFGRRWVATRRQPAV